MHASAEVSPPLRRHDKPQWASWWWAMMCALLLVAPAQVSAGSLSQTRQMCAPHQAVFSWLERAGDTDSQTRAAVLQTLCKRAGLDELNTARILHSYQQWTQSQETSPAQTAQHSFADFVASTCSPLSRVELLKTRLQFAPRDLPHTGRAPHSLAVCYLE